MKRSIFVLSIFLISGSLQAQSMQDVFKDKQMTWYGLDFSQAKFIGAFTNTGPKDSKSPTVLRDIYFEGWNYVIVNEKKKYNLQFFFDKNVVKYDLSKVRAINSSVDTATMMATSVVPFTGKQIQQAVLNYRNKDTSGLGLVFIIESFDRNQDLGTMHAAFFDIATGIVLFTKKVKSTPDGMGVRNYWIRTVYNSMEAMHKNWKTWAKEAGI